MKILAFEVRDDEKKGLMETAQELGVELELSSEVPCMENVELVNGFEGVSVLGQGDINSELLSAWKKQGVDYVSTRTIGYNHIDVENARKIGIRVCNARYAPNGVADFTVMLMLMCLRNYKQALWRGQVNDFSLWGLQGKEMRSLTVGVMGTGRIGQAVIQNLRGFGCKILAYDPHPKADLMDVAEYVSLEELYRRADIITLHMPLVPATKYIINRESISMMKPGVIIINCARGPLADPDALIEGIESEKIGALGLDVIDGEEGITHVDHRVDIISNQKMAYLRQFRNVVMTQHMAFYTEEAVASMARCGIAGIQDMAENKKGQWEI
nr:D-isomer specific 2-hydroxyacid dehydrogenase family protein [uncultured Blautia sp.]